MANVTSDVKALIKQHPDWTNLQLFDALKSKYDAQSLASTVATEMAATQAAAKTAKGKADAAAKAALRYYTPDEIAAQILSGASTDPTATGTATGAKIIPTVGGAGTQFGADAWQADFSDNGNLEYSFDAKTNKYYIARRNADGTNPQVYILGDPANPGQYKAVDPTTALTETITDYKSKPNGIAALRRQIVASRKIPTLTGNKAAAFIAQGNSIDKTLSAYLAKTLEDMTIDNFYSGRSNKTFSALNGFLSGTGAGGVTTKTSVSKNIEYSNAEANAAEIASFVQEYLGRGATAKEVTDYQDAIKQIEKNRPTKRTTTVTGDQTSIALGLAKTTTGVTEAGGVSPEERKAMQVAVVSKALKAAGVDPAAISKSGGKVAQVMDILKQNAAAYALQFDDKMALDAAIKSIQPGADYKSEIEKMKQIAKVKYKNLASALDGGATVADIADQFQQYKNKTLELTGPTNVFDPDIQKALNNDGKTGIMSVTDFNTYLRSKPEWAKTQNAREEAANYANTILKQFGFMA